jgi:hypothetical protein
MKKKEREKKNIRDTSNIKLLTISTIKKLSETNLTASRKVTNNN